ncbi:MAG: hypothetical protein HYZ49_10665 [Chloroflexi bacterium]|nr:hypothetical protein [Chloroflexota bacterium]
MIEQAPAPTRYFPDRDRLSVLTAVILLAYALTRVVELPAREFSARLFGSSIGVEVNGQVIILLMVAALISSGSDTLIRSHPRFSGGVMSGPVHWVLPGATALALGLILNLAPLGPAWWLGLALSALLLVIVLVAEYIVVERTDPAFGAASFGLTALTFIVALAIFGWIRFTGTRAALSATSAALLGGLLALRLFLLNQAEAQRSLIFAGVIGLTCGETMWALNYWRVTPIGAGLLLLVLFYALHGLAQQHLAGQLNRRVIVEFAVVGMLGGIIALSLALPR